MAPMVVFCSVATRQSLPGARVLASTLRSRDPDARIVVCVVGAHDEVRREEDFEVVRPHHLVIADQDDDGPEAPTEEALPARLLQWALAEGADAAVYLAPSIAVYDTLDPAVAAAREHGIALARRVRLLPEDGRHPDAADLVAAGAVTPSLAAVAGEQGERFARWWAEGITRSGAPARWLEIAADVFGTVGWLDDPGVAVSMWNLHERSLERRDGALLAGGRPLRCFDFAGFRADRPYMLGEHTTRISPAEDPVLAELCGEHAERLRAAQWTAPEPDAAIAERLATGLAADPLLSALWDDARAAGLGLVDRSSPLVAEAFAGWLREPAAQGGGAGVNRYLYGAYRRRPDLQSTFPDLDADGEGLIAWAWERGRAEGLLAELLPRSGDVADGDLRLSVNVVGYLRDTLGLAEAARLYITSLTAAGVPVGTTAVAPDLALDLAGDDSTARYGQREHIDTEAPFEPAFNLVCLNGDQLSAFMHAGGSELLGERPTIGVWAWETDAVPPSWIAGFQYVDEIWVNSTFVARNLARLAPVPVVVVPQAIDVPDPAGAEVDLIDERAFTFLFMFDYFSTLQRKNPIGLVEAFKRAFAPGEGPRLLIKTMNEKLHRDAAAELRAHADGRPDIEIIERYLEPSQIAALIAKAGCYASLHRSEGFGLTLVDAMALGTPVIATGYSGNMDFTTERNSYLVDWTPTQVGPGNPVYPPEGWWAEPDLAHAASLMRRVWEHRDEAAAKAERARSDIERQYSPAATGRVARARLQTLLELRHDMPGSLASGSFKTIERELKLDLRRGVPSRRAATGALRQAVMRMMLPFTLHERNLDRAVLDALRELRRDLDRERARGARARARLRRIEEALTRAKDSVRT
jgi:hypothetical protein